MLSVASRIFLAKERAGLRWSLEVIVVVVRRMLRFEWRSTSFYLLLLLLVLHLHSQFFLLSLAQAQLFFKLSF